MDELDTDAMNQLLYDVLQGKESPSIPGEAAAAHFAKLKEQVPQMIKDGIMPMPVRD